MQAGNELTYAKVRSIKMELISFRVIWTGNFRWGT
jgi:hypothetical protein